jgi:hypothetical protein
VVYRVRPKNRKTSNFAVIGLMRFWNGLTN